MKFRILSLSAALLLAVVLISAGCGGKEKAKSAAKKTVAKSAAKSGTSTSAKKDDKTSEDKVPVKPIETGTLLDAYLNPGGAKSAGSSASPLSGAPLTGAKGIGAASPMPPVGAKPVPPASLPAAARPTAQQLFDVLRSLYVRASTLKADGTTTIIVKADGKVLQQVNDMPTTLLFKRPNKFVITAPDSRVSSDGKTVYMYSSQDRRYVKAKMSNEVFGQIATSKLGVGIVGLLVGMDYSKGVSSLKLLKDAQLGGKGMYVLSIQWKKGVATPPDTDATQMLWVGKQDLGIYKNEVITRTKPTRPKGYTGEMPKLVQSVTTQRIVSFTAGKDIPDSKFAFTPPSGAKEMEQPKQISLLDKHAPDFTFKAANGSSKKLSDLRGQTVLLSFWALPACEGMLPVLQKVNDQHKDDTSIVTINLNDDAAEVKKYLAGKEFSFPYAMGDKAIAQVLKEKYGLMGLPTTYIIDSNGIVRRELRGIPTAADIDAKLRKISGAG